MALLVVWSFTSGVANAQRLWSVEEANRAPDGPAVVLDGIAVVPGGSAGVPLRRAAAEVQVTFDYLRLGMGYLELPLWDGSVIEAENAVFEDRGNGNLMWTGEVPGAGYESVLFTVQDGYLVGWFGEPGGPKYVVHAGPDGRGSLAVEVGPTGDWCGVGRGGGKVAGLDRALASVDSPGIVTAAANPNSLDILVLYTTGTEQYWREIGGPAVGIRQLGDYLDMVFRNGALPATANLIAVRWDPSLFGHPNTQGRHSLRWRDQLWRLDYRLSPEVARLRQLYAPDLVHFVNRGPGWGGAADLRTNLDTDVLMGHSTPSPTVFAHEIGHNLGGDHEPVTFGAQFGEYQRSAFRPYMFGHTDLTSCGRREGAGVLVCPATVMSYGDDVREDPKRGVATEPFYSSVRHKPNGWTIGVAGTSEVERVFHETVPVAVRSGEAPYKPEQLPKTIRARWTDRDKVRVTWQEGVRAGFWVYSALVDGGNDRYYSSGDAWLRPLVENGSYVGVDVSGLRPGGEYRLSVRGATADVLSDAFFLKKSPPALGAPASPSNVGADVVGANAVRLRWRDNSSDESGFEVWYRKWSGAEPDEVWRPYGQRPPADARSIEVDGLLAEERLTVTSRSFGVDYLSGPGLQDTKRGRYSFVVVAYNDKGFSASEPFHFDFVPSPYPAPTVRGMPTDCAGHATGLEIDGFRILACFEAPDGSRRRVWDYGLDSDRSGLLYFFDRDNVEFLVKVLDGCAVNGHRWVFVAPVTDLAFRLGVAEPSGTPFNQSVWYYDSKRLSQDQIVHGTDGNPKGLTARTVSDTTAFPCTTAETAAAKSRASQATGGESAFPAHPRRGAEGSVASAGRLSSGSRTDCNPSGVALTLRGGYTVGMCYETESGETGVARDWGLESSRMGLLYFSDRDLVEALIKVRDDCAVGGNVSVSVAPATTAAFNLRVESPNGYVWSHSNGLGETAEAVSDVSAFPCSGSPPETLVCTGVTCLLQGERFRVKAWYSKGGSPSQKAGAIAAALGASAGLFGGDSAGPELLVRVVNRCRTSGWWEVHGGVASDADFRFAIRDTKTNALKWFRSSGRSVVDTEAFACTESDFGAMAGGAPADPGASCTGATCLLRDRLFRVKSWYRLDNGSSGPAAAVSVDLGGSAGLYAFESDNPELLVRIADTCSTTGYWTVYAGAASDASFSVAVRDTETNELKWFRSRGGQAIVDDEAFSCG